MVVFSNVVDDVNENHHHLVMVSDDDDVIANLFSDVDYLLGVVTNSSEG